METNEAARTEQQSIRATYRDRENTKDFNALHLAAMLAKRRPDLRDFQVALDAAHIYSLAKSQAALSVASCNVGLTERQERRQESIAKQIHAVAAFYGLTAMCYGDPRGYTVRLTGEGVGQYGWGDGFGVA